MTVVLVLVAHSGRTLQLASVQPSTSVAAVQEVLQDLAGVPVSEQIVMSRGARLDPSRQLASYGLPSEEDAEEDNPVFLYSRLYIRPGAAPPPAEEVPGFVIRANSVGEVNGEHPLLSAQTVQLRELPGYEVQFQHHQLTGQEYWKVSQKYFLKCQQLLSEQEVQSRAIDAARGNIQVHYNAINASFTEFLEGYIEQKKQHGELLGRFEVDMDVLRTTEIHPRLQGEGCRKLADLLPEKRLREWADSCRKAHKQFAEKVANLQGLFSMLKRDVESLFMQAPSIDLDDLGRLLGIKEDVVEEHGSIVQVLSKDLVMVRKLVEDSVKLLGSDGGNNELIFDACSALESINESHTEQLVPRLKECTAMLENFCKHCIECKDKMTAEIVSQLQQISVQQSRIRDMKNKLAAFREVHTKQEEAFAELALVRRIPAAYKAALSECVRRKAWTEMYSGQATRLAEHMGKVRSREIAKRDAILKEAECILPQELLSKMGLTEYPPHCEIHIPSQEQKLLPVTIDEVRRIGAPHRQETRSHKLSDVNASEESAGPSEYPMGGSTAPSLMSSTASGAPSTSMTIGENDLELENAKLRADLAGCIAQQQLQYASNPQAAGEHAETSSQEKPVQLSRSVTTESQDVSRNFVEALHQQQKLNAIFESRLEAALSLNTKYEARVLELLQELEAIRGQALCSEEDKRVGNAIALHIAVPSHPDNDEGEAPKTIPFAGDEDQPCRRNQDFAVGVHGADDKKTDEL